jgi:hypothetical protein
MRYMIVLSLLLLTSVVACDRKDMKLTSSNITAIAIDPWGAQKITEGSTLTLKAVCTGAEETTAPAWSVENNLGTFDPATGKETVFTAGKTPGTGRIYATYGCVRGETTVTVGNGSGTTTTNTGTGGGCGGGTTSGWFYGLFSETFVVPGILLDTDSSRFEGGGCIGVWPDGNNTLLAEATQPGEMSEGTKALKCTVGILGGWWIQFGSDDLPGLSEKDIIAARDMSSFANGSLKFDVRSSKDVLIKVSWGRGDPLPNAYYTLRELGVPCDGQWHSVSVPLSRFTGIDFSEQNDKDTRVIFSGAGVHRFHVLRG